MNKEFSAGGIIERIEKDCKEILLVEHLDKTYVFPKGHIEEGETPEAAAAREIKEETGFSNVKIGDNLGIVTRNTINSKGEKAIKDITMFRVRVGGVISEKEEVTKWFSISDALGVLRYKEDKNFLSKLYCIEK